MNKGVLLDFYGYLRGSLLRYSNQSYLIDYQKDLTECVLCNSHGCSYKGWGYDKINHK